MQRIEAPPSAVRTVVTGVSIALAGIIMGRLILERTGAGLGIFLVSLPVVFIIAAALLGIVRAALLLSLFATIALVIRIVALEAGWVVLLLVPVIGITSYILANTVAMMRREREEEEAESA